MPKETKDEKPAQGKEYTPGTGKFDSLKVNQSISGSFLGARWQEIEDQRTHLRKEIFVLRIREENGTIRRVPCAAMMLQAWDEIVDDHGNGDPEACIRNIRGRQITIKRLADSATKGGNQLGTYTLIVGA